MKNVMLVVAVTVMSSACASLNPGRFVDRKCFGINCVNVADPATVREKCHAAHPQMKDRPGFQNPKGCGIPTPDGGREAWYIPEQYQSVSAGFLCGSNEACIKELFGR